MWPLFITIIEFWSVIIIDIQVCNITSGKRKVHLTTPGSGSGNDRNVYGLETLTRSNAKIQWLVLYCAYIPATKMVLILYVR